jgi:hypothetical protein
MPVCAFYLQARGLGPGGRGGWEPAAAQRLCAGNRPTPACTDTHPGALHPCGALALPATGHLQPRRLPLPSRGRRPRGPRLRRLPGGPLPPRRALQPPPPHAAHASGGAWGAAGRGRRRLQRRCRCRRRRRLGREGAAAGGRAAGWEEEAAGGLLSARVGAVAARGLGAQAWSACRHCRDHAPLPLRVLLVLAAPPPSPSRGRPTSPLACPHRLMLRPQQTRAQGPAAGRARQSTAPRPRPRPQQQLLQRRSGGSGGWRCCCLPITHWRPPRNDWLG